MESSPVTAYRVWKQEFLDKINKHSVRHYPEDDPHDYNFKRRLLNAKKIPPSFIVPDKEGGYTVFSQNIKRRYWKYDRTRYHYSVYKTVFGYWICTCTDFSFFTPRPCKHVIAVVLFKHGLKRDDPNSIMARKIKFCLSDELRELEEVIET